ncbi:YpoC family protein [Bacillus sp. LL01]|uniref:YpoC family protein n=1 Tax=Bacillus sp. LL01 TaxID=1665556 RepID=UPI00069DD6A7|nr:hypothetical protein [Bacillus sp. LL01]
MKIPEAFIHPYFYTKKDSININHFDMEDIITIPFKYDIAYYQGAAPYKLPWENTSDSIPLILISWKAKQSTLNTLHENRDRRGAKEEMIPAIGWFLQMQFWMNGQPVRSINDWKRDIDSLKWTPINVDERFDFVLKKPELYHSFIQLQQLFTEGEKLFYKSKALENRETNQ